MSKDIYLSKHEELQKARAEENEELEGRILGELDGIWFALSVEEMKEVNEKVCNLVRSG